VRRLLALLSCLLLGGCLVGAVSTPRQITVGDGAGGARQAFGGELDELIARAGRSYVSLAVQDPTVADTQEGGLPVETVTAASGIAIDGQGHVLTAAHVAIAKNWKVKAIGPDGRSYEGRVLATMPSMDSALIKLTRYDGLQPVVPVEDPCLTVGSPIFSLGKPRSGSDIARIGSVVSLSFGQPVSYQGYGYTDAMVLRLQTRQGESGGPVFNRRGELVGMLVSTLSDGNGRPLDLAHAVSAPMLAEFICSSTSCTPRWRSLIGKSVSRCARRRKASG